MAAKKVGELIKEARTAAGLTQEKLGNAVGLAASDISKAERGELDLTDAALKKIAKATGVTQASLLNAPKSVPASKAKTTAAKSTTAAKTTAKTTTTKTTAAKTTAKTTAATKTTAAKSTAAKSTTTSKTTTAAKTPANADTSMKVTSAEKKLIELYRAATGNQKKAATKILKGESDDLIDNVLANSEPNGVADLIGDMVGSLFGVKK